MSEKKLSLQGSSQAWAQLDSDTTVICTDLDGTLLNTEYLWAEAFAACGCVPTYPEGSSESTVINSLLESGVKNLSDLLSKATDYVSATLKSQPEKVENTHLIEQLLLFVRRGGVVAIVTNSTLDDVDSYRRALPNFGVLCDELGIESIFTLDREVTPKPDPALYVLAIDYLIERRSSMKRCIIFEDSKTGLSSARGALEQFSAITGRLEQVVCRQ